MYLSRLCRNLAAIGVALVIAACASTVSLDPRQQAVDATFKSGASVDAAVTATRGAVRSGQLKGQDALNALRALETAQASVKAAEAALRAQPAIAPAAPAASAPGVK